MKQTIKNILFAAILANSLTANASTLLGPKEYANMDGVMTRVVGLESNNYINLKFPYEGNTHLRMGFSKSGSNLEFAPYNRVTFVIDQGQIYCPKLTSCDMKFKIDDNPSQNLKFSTDSIDGSTKSAFIVSGVSGFILKLKGANNIKVEIPIYENGVQTFSFDLGQVQPELKYNISKAERENKTKNEKKAILEKLKQKDLPPEQVKELKQNLALLEMYEKI